jgi:excisionase family DNA binding protein
MCLAEYVRGLNDAETNMSELEDTNAIDGSARGGSMNGLPDVATLQETADYLRITTNKLRTLALSHKIGALKIGREYTFPKAAVEAFIESNTTPVVAPNPFGLSDASLRRIRSTRKPPPAVPNW